MFKTVGDSLYGKKERISAVGILINVVLVFLVAVLAAEMIFSANYTGIYVINRSMTPTFTGAESKYEAGGDYVYIKTGAKPDYGDIVVLYWEEQNENIIKRAVAFGGDTVKIERGQLMVKYKGTKEYTLIEESYAVFNDPDKSVNTFAKDFGHVVEEGGVFLLGDNRDESNDSRQNGDFPLKNVLGVVPQWSINCKAFTTAWHRFFRFTLKGI